MWSLAKSTKNKFYIQKVLFGFLNQNLCFLRLSGIGPNFYFISSKGWRVIPARQTGQNQEYFGYNPRYRNIASKLSLNLSSIINTGIQGESWGKPFFFQISFFFSVLISKSWQKITNTCSTFKLSPISKMSPKISILKFSWVKVIYIL